MSERATEPLAAASGRVFNGPHAREHTSRVAFPLGGIGAGMLCLEGSGALPRRRPATFPKARKIDSMWKPENALDFKRPFKTIV